MLGKLLEFLYPSNCIVCGRGSDPDTDGLFCTSCLPEPRQAREDQSLYGLPDSIRSLACGCSRCGEAMTVHNASSPVCVACSVWPLPIGQLRSQHTYEGSIEAAIKAMKYNGERRLISFFAERLADDLMLPGTLFNTSSTGVHCADFWDLMVAVPSSVSSLRSRGFGHTAFIARKAAYALNIKSSATVLKSTRPRKRQVDCAPQERFTNVADCFRAEPESIRGRRILLFDDVLTTGATITSAAAALLDAGAKSVDAVTIARSRQFRSLRLMRSDSADPPSSKVVGWDA